MGSSKQKSEKELFGAERGFTAGGLPHQRGGGGLQW